MLTTVTDAPSPTLISTLAAYCALPTWSSTTVAVACGATSTTTWPYDDATGALGADHDRVGHFAGDSDDKRLGRVRHRDRREPVERRVHGADARVRHRDDLDGRSRGPRVGQRAVGCRSGEQMHVGAATRQIARSLAGCSARENPVGRAKKCGRDAGRLRRRDRACALRAQAGASVISARARCSSPSSRSSARV